MMKRIAVIGTGIMGTGIGLTLMEHGYELSCWNRTEAHAQRLIKAGASFCSSPAAAAEGADLVIMMLWNKAALESALRSEEGLFAGAAADQIFIDMSTQLPETAKWAAESFAQKAAHFLDAPVHGTKGEAESGGLWIMAGGERAIFDRAVEILSVIGETAHYMGPHGSGYAAKLCGNHLVSSIVAALCESMTLAGKAGLDREELLKVWMESDFRSPVVDGVGHSILNRDFDVSFHLRTMVKDTELIHAYAEELKVPMLIANVVHELNKTGENMGFGEENASAVVKVFERMAGL